MAKHLISLLTEGRMTVFHVPPDISNCCEFKRERKELEKLEKLNKVSARARSYLYFDFGSGTNSTVACRIYYPHTQKKERWHMSKILTVTLRI